MVLQIDRGWSRIRNDLLYVPHPSELLSVAPSERIQLDPITVFILEIPESPTVLFPAKCASGSHAWGVEELAIAVDQSVAPHISHVSLISDSALDFEALCHVPCQYWLASRSLGRWSPFLPRSSRSLWLGLSAK